MFPALTSVVSRAVAVALGAGLAAANAGEWQSSKTGWGAPRDPFVGEVSTAFQQLGMAETRADCFGEVLLVRLKPENRAPAVALLRASRTSGEVRRQVTAGGFDMIGGFRAANQACPQGAGS